MKTAIHHLFVNVSEICRSISFLMWTIFIILYKSRGSCGVGVGRQSGAGQGQLSGQAGGRVVVPVPAAWTCHLCRVGGASLLPGAWHPGTGEKGGGCGVCRGWCPFAPQPSPPRALGERQRWGRALSCELPFISLLFVYVQAEAEP